MQTKGSYGASEVLPDRLKIRVFNASRMKVVLEDDTLGFQAPDPLPGDDMDTPTSL